MPPKSKADPNQIILQFLEDKNRPYSATNLVDELHGEFSKTVIQKSLDSLTESNKITCKLFGKSTKLYFPVQDGKPIASKDELHNLDEHLEHLMEENANLKSKIDELRAKRDALKTTLTIDQLRQKRITIETELSKEITHKNDLVHLSEGISPENALKIQKRYTDSCQQWHQRKNKCKEIIDALSEMMDKKPSEVINMMELDTDEANNVTIEFKNKVFVVNEL